MVERAKRDAFGGQRGNGLPRVCPAIGPVSYPSMGVQLYGQRTGGHAAADRGVRHRLLMKRLSAKDIDFVRRIMTDESVYPFIIDDGSPPPDEFPVELFLGNEKVFVLSPNDGSVFLFVPIRHRVYEVHTCVLPGYRGLTAIQSGKAVVYWMFANTDAAKIFSIIPENNRAYVCLALWFQERGGTVQGVVSPGENDQHDYRRDREVKPCQQEPLLQPGSLVV